MGTSKRRKRGAVYVGAVNPYMDRLRGRATELVEGEHRLAIDLALEWGKHLEQVRHSQVFRTALADVLNGIEQEKRSPQ